MAFFRPGSIITDFKIVVNNSTKNEAQSDIAKKIHELLSRGVNVTYSGQAFVVDEVTVTNSMGQNTSKHICVNKYIKFESKLVHLMMEVVEKKVCGFILQLLIS